MSQSMQVWSTKKEPATFSSRGDLLLACRQGQQRLASLAQVLADMEPADMVFLKYTHGAARRGCSIPVQHSRLQRLVQVVWVQQQL